MKAEVQGESGVTNEMVTLNKGLGGVATHGAVTDVAQLGWNLLGEDLSLPTAVLYRDKLVHNRDWMQRFVQLYGVRLAPHGKTTMAPSLFRMQMDGGAWGITLATVQQVAVAHAFGIRRVLMANQLVGRRNMEIISDALRDEGFEFFCLVDSADQVDQLGSFFAGRNQRLNVLLELGVHGGRSGVRDDEQLERVLEAMARWTGTVRLCGAEVYEGVLQEESAIRDFLRRAVAVTSELAQAGRFGREPIVLSGAGSAWYDVVAEEFSKLDAGGAVEIVLRPGCYLTHDVGAYLRAQTRIDASNPVAKQMGSSLQPALQLWAYIQSIPEPGLAIMGFGKRDAAFDAGFPSPALHFRPGQVAPSQAKPGWCVTKMMDQHAFLQFVSEDDLRVGDMVAFDISHPCLTFDRWRFLPVLDASFKVVDLVETFF